MDKDKVSVLVMCLADPSGSPRPRRVIELCKNLGYFVSVASYPISGFLYIDKHYTINCPRKNFLFKVLRWLKSLLFLSLGAIFKSKVIRDLLNNLRYGVHNLNNLKNERYNIIIVEDLQLLPVSFMIKNNAKIIFDAREYYPRQNEESLFFRLFEKHERIRLCNEYLTKCDQLLTVSNGLAKEYKNEFGVDMEVLRSTPNYVHFHIKFPDKSLIRLVHHGYAGQNRKIECMIEVMKYLDDRFCLDLYLTENHKYIERLKLQSRDCSRIRFLNPVPYDKILPMLNKYDIGLFLLQPTGFNKTYCLPNKLFEFIQARLAVAIGPSPDMSEIVNEYQCGVVAPSFNPESLAECLSKLTTDDIDIMKQNSDKAAKELCYEIESLKFIDLMQNAHSR